MKALINREPPKPGEAATPFISHQGNNISLGNCKSVDNIPKFEYQRNEFLFHHEGPTPQPTNQGSLAPPKSFYSVARRSQATMTNPRAQENSAYSDVVEKRKDLTAQQRSQDMVDRSHRTGYNVITGDIYGKGPKPNRQHSRHIPDGLGPESHNRGIQQLKDSCNRYFIPQER